MKNNKYKILSIDPGTTACGWSILEYDPSSPIITVLKLGVIASRKIVIRAAMRDRVAIYGKTILSLEILREKVDEIIKQNKPDFIAIENAFFNPKFPSAYAILIQCIFTIEQLIYSKYGLPLYKIPTRSAKETLSGNGGAKKETIQDIILNHQDITFKNEKLKYTITQDESDAIAIGFHMCHKLLPTLILSQQNDLIKEAS